MKRRAQSHIRGSSALTGDIKGKGKPSQVEAQNAERNDMQLVANPNEYCPFKLIVGCLMGFTIHVELKYIKTIAQKARGKEMSSSVLGFLCLPGYGKKYVYTYIYITYVCLYVCIYTHTHVCVSLCVCICQDMVKYIYTHMYVYFLYTHTHIYWTLVSKRCMYNV